MSASVVQICNNALLKFGNITISDLTDNTPQAQACNVLYPLMRDELLEAHNWNFAMARADISAQLATTPAFQWGYAYTLPADCLRVVELYGTDDEWVREGNEILTNKEEEIYIRYVKQVTTSGNFSMYFANCLSVRLAAELVAKLKEDKNMRLELLQELENVWIPEAYRLNAIEGNRQASKGEQSMDNGNFAWQTEGRGGA